MARPDASARRAAYRRGLWAEWAAVLWLGLKGYRLEARRVRTGPGEIDLVMRRGGLTVFVEVKARAALGDAREAVPAAQQQRLAAAARTYLARRPGGSGAYRFDAVFIAPWHRPRHVPALFEG